MIRIYDGKFVVDLQMTEEGVDSFDEVGFFADGKLDICDDFMTSDRTVYAVADAEYCVDYAEDWANCCGDFYDDFEAYMGKRYVIATRWAHVLIVGGENDGMVAFVGSDRDAQAFAAAAEEKKQGDEMYVVFGEDGEEY